MEITAIAILGVILITGLFTFVVMSRFWRIESENRKLYRQILAEIRDLSVRLGSQPQPPEPEPKPEPQGADDGE